MAGAVDWSTATPPVASADGEDNLESASRAARGSRLTAISPCLQARAPHAAEGCRGSMSERRLAYRRAAIGGARNRPGVGWRAGRLDDHAAGTLAQQGRERPIEDLRRRRAGSDMTIAPRLHRARLVDDPSPGLAGPDLLPVAGDPPPDLDLGLPR